MSTPEDRIPSIGDYFGAAERVQTPTIDEYFGQQQGQDSGFLDLLKRFEGATAPDYGRIYNELKSVGGWLDSHGEAMMRSLSPTQLLARLMSGEPIEEAIAPSMVTMAGIVGEGIVEPLAGLAGLPTALIGAGNNRVENFLARAAQGMYDTQEQFARSAGMTDEDIKAHHEVGGFIGFTAPIVGSVKIAQLLLRTKQAIGAHAVAGDFMTDFVAGLVYGGLFQQGDAKERLISMGEESAMFGVTRLLLMGAVPVVKAFRNKRAYEIDQSGRLSQLISDIENGRPVSINEAEMPGILKLLEDETYLTHSPAAQELLRQNAYDVALQQAIVDAAQKRGGAGVFTHVGRTFEEAGARIQRFMEQFPGLKFTAPIKRELKTTHKRIVGEAEPPVPEGMTRLYRGQILKPSQIFTGDEAAGRSFTSKKEVAQSYADLAKKQEGESGLFYVDLPADVAAKYDSGAFTGLHNLPRPLANKAKPLKLQEVIEEVRDIRYDVYFGTQALSPKKLKQLKVEGRFEGQVLQYGDSEVVYVGPGKKAGTLKVRSADGRVKHIKASNVTDTPFAREDWAPTPEWDALFRDFFVWAESKTREVARQRGMIPERDLISAIRSGRITVAEDGRRAFDSGGALVHPEEIGLSGEEALQAIQFNPVQDPDRGLLQAFITRSPRSQGPAAGLSSSTRAEAEVVAPKWRVTVVGEQGPLGHQSFENLDEAVQFTRDSGWGDPAKVTRKYPTGDEVSGLISQSLTDQAQLLDAPPSLTFENIFDMWAKEKGLDPNAVDYVAARTSFGDRMRRELWEQVPAADRKIYEDILAAQEKLLEDYDFPLEVLANQKGFHLKRLPNGLIQARELNTGLVVQFGTERQAREGLLKIVRPETNIPSIIPDGMAGLQAFTGGLPVQDIMHFPDNIQSLETKLDLPYKWIRNVRDWLIAVEKQTGIPLWSQGFDKIDQGKSKFLADYDPWAKEIQSTWKGIKRDRKYAIVDYWVDAESRELTLNEAVREMREAGFNANEIGAFTRSRAMFDKWFEMSGIERGRYIETYYTRIRPFVDDNGVLDVQRALGQMDVRPAEFQFWAEMTRTGDISLMEKDPELVMHKYIRALLWNKHIKEHWDRVAVLTGTRTSPAIKIKDLPPDMQDRIMSQASIGTTPNSPVLPAQMRSVLTEYLNVIRGTPGASLETIRSFSVRLFHQLGIKTDARVLEEFTNTLMSTWYGAAMGMRPSLVARNMTQSVWLLYTRIGAKQMGPALEMSMTREGFMEPLMEGAIRLQEAGVPYGDLVTQTIMDHSAEGTKGPLSMALASAIRKGLRLGDVSRDMATKTLIPYSSSDQASRAWSYWAQKMHTGEWLEKYEKGRISWDKFLDEGLPFFDEVIQTRFRQILDLEGKERALRFAAKMGADETNFIYGVGAQPAWMQTIPGRMVGMFGTWPLWASELYFRRIRNGTLKQQAAFVARNAALIGAFANMSIESGIAMWNWISPTSMLGWGGGPAVKLAIDLNQVATAPIDEKGRAMKRMVDDGLRLSFPGQSFIRDLQVVGEQYDPEKAFLSLMLGRPIDKGNWSVDMLYDPMADPTESWVPPDRLQELKVPNLGPVPGKIMFDFSGRPATPSTSESMQIRQPAPLELLQGNLP